MGDQDGILSDYDCSDWQVPPPPKGTVDAIIKLIYAWGGGSYTQVIVRPGPEIGEVSVKAYPPPTGTKEEDVTGVGRTFEAALGDLFPRAVKAAQAWSDHKREWAEHETREAQRVADAVASVLDKSNGEGG